MSCKFNIYSLAFEFAYSKWYLHRLEEKYLQHKQLIMVVFYGI